MKKTYFFKINFVLLLILLFVSKVNAQTFTDSNLPIVIIVTDGAAAIPDDPKILGNMTIIKHPDGTRNYMTDVSLPAFVNYTGRIGIEIRGSSSQALPKKPYAITTLIAGSTVTTTTQNVSLLGMPSENDWVLNSLAFDQSCIRDYIAYNLSRQMGNYASRMEYCEVVINGEYRGLYMLGEKLKADSNRIDINKIAPADNTLPKLTGGYITKADKTTGGDPVAWSMPSYAGNTNFIHDFPKPTAVTPAQNTYIKSVFDDLQAKVTANNVTLLNGYTTVIDVPTFVDFMISNEYFANVDGYQLSSYFHKDRNGKLRAGPLWDFNLTLGNDLFQWGYNRSFTNTWQFNNGDNEGAKFWKDLFNNPEYKCYLAKRWFELTAPGKVLNQTQVNALIDGTIVLITEALGREQTKWGTVGNNTSNVADLKTWITARITWVNANIGSAASCSNVATPPLVITRIHYNPAIAGTTPSNDQEFIQITNTGSTPVNMSGIYFSQLGTTYQFPYNSIIPANSYIYLAANGVVFQAINGFPPFGLFSRNLSNTSQNIVLADAWGNIIDQVNYADTAPWPVAADGGGSYMQLISTNLDNNLGSSWVAKSQNGLGSSCCN